VLAQVLPGDKANKVKQVRNQLPAGSAVAFVGDGINDSPALVEADCGIAVASGTDVAIDAADIVLMKNNLGDIVTALSICHRTFWRIRLNFFFAFAYNSIAIPIAAGVLYPIWKIGLPPALAAAAMALSSVSVVSSSLALRWFTPPTIQGVPSGSPREHTPLLLSVRDD